MPDGRERKVMFAEKKLSEAYNELKEGRFEEKQLYLVLESAIKDLKKDPFCGIKLPSRLWPKEYVRKYGINNLRKIDLPNGWRLIYTLVGDRIEIISILLEWMTHKEYEKRFGYKAR